MLSFPVPKNLRHRVGVVMQKRVLKLWWRGGNWQGKGLECRDRRQIYAKHDQYGSTRPRGECIVILPGFRPD